MAEHLPKSTAAHRPSAVSDAGDPRNAQPHGEPPERRRSPRLPLTVTAHVFEVHSNARILGRTTDLGLGGCYVDTISPFPDGTLVKLRLTRANKTFETHATVMYARAGMGMSLAFTEVQPDQLQILEGWLAGPSGEPEIPSDAAEGLSTTRPSDLRQIHVLNQLISLLVRKHIITDAEGTTLLRELFR